MMYRAIALLAALPLTAQLRDLKPGFNLFSPEHDIQIGKESAAQVERTRPMVRDNELTGYLTRIAGRLAASKRSGEIRAVRGRTKLNCRARAGGGKTTPVRRVRCRIPPASQVQVPSNQP